MSHPIDVLGLGNSLIDLIALTDDAYLVEQEMLKGAMTLIDEDRAEALYAARQARQDRLGRRRRPTRLSASPRSASAPPISARSGMTSWARSSATTCAPPASPTILRSPRTDPATGRCFVYVTPDGERTMNTFLGASTYLSPDDVDEALVRSARFVYLEGYMWDRPDAKEAFRKAGRIAHENGARVALTLSDGFCVDRFRGEFIDLMRTKVVDTVFANTDEALSLYETTHLHEALDAFAAEGVCAVVTRSEKGCVIVEGEARTQVPAHRDRAVGRHDRGGRSVCGGLSGGAGARRGTRALRAAGGAGGERDDPAHRRQAADVVAGAGREGGVEGLKTAIASPVVHTLRSRSWPGLSRPSTSGGDAHYPDNSPPRRDVDIRDEPGHDGSSRD